MTLPGLTSTAPFFIAASCLALLTLTLDLCSRCPRGPIMTASPSPIDVTSLDFFLAAVVCATATVEMPITRRAPAANSARFETDIRFLLVSWLRPPGGGQHPARYGCARLTHLADDKNTPS